MAINKQQDNDPSIIKIYDAFLVEGNEKFLSHFGDSGQNKDCLPYMVNTQNKKIKKIKKKKK